MHSGGHIHSSFVNLQYYPTNILAMKNLVDVSLLRLVGLAHLETITLDKNTIPNKDAYVSSMEELFPKNLK